MAEGDYELLGKLLLLIQASGNREGEEGGSKKLLELEPAPQQLLIIDLCRRGHCENAPDILTCLLESKRGEELIHARDFESGRTLLHLLSASIGFAELSMRRQRYRFQMLEMLLEAGADPTALDKEQKTPLALARENLWFSDPWFEALLM